jgi:competence protein ComEC
MLSRAYLWNKAPFIRFLISLITGIVLQWQLQFSLLVLIYFSGSLALLLIIHSLFSIKIKFSLRLTSGICLKLLIVSAGALLVWQKDIRHNEQWIGHHYRQHVITATLQEPLVEKANSYKAIAIVNSIYANDTSKSVTGNIIVYFKKDSSLLHLTYGSQIAFINPLQEIKNSGNPGSFDYKRYSLFQGITHQVYLTAKDVRILSSKNTDPLQKLIFSCREWVVKTLKNNIDGKKEAGLAEALLIGYKDDLDKSLVESYSNTGVVHVIAISGLHLGLIYWLLLLITKPIKRIRGLSWFRLLMILLPLWAFTLLAGVQPSVLRSAVMFSFIAVGEVVSRKTSIYNTLALSAFVLLCLNPFWLWDVGFQLSYAAVLSIVTFFQPIYNWLYFNNRLLDFFWKLNAVTIAAQLLTVPISMYHFHQFPVIFLLTNFVAVPLSSLILIGEIALCILSVIPVLASLLGKVLHWLIYFMNSYIEELDKLPFAVWPSMSVSILQMFLLISFIVCTCFWLIEKQRIIFWTAVTSLLWFISLRSLSFYQAYGQKKLIVYNVPKHQAIDVIDGRSFYFIGDSVLLQDGFIRNFHLNPSRIRHRVNKNNFVLSNAKCFSFYNKKLFIVDEPIMPATTMPELDIIILSKNPKLYISQLKSSFSFQQIVLDGSVPAWKAKLWKRDCDSLKIPYYDVTEKGAFVMNL